jgi:hypothetical protein
MSEVLLNLLNSNLLDPVQPSLDPPRRACISDFLEDTCHSKNQHYSQNDTISKNQQEFGHRKRIKP